MPTRYVSGYLFRDVTAAHRSSEDATHAWAEALIPGAGWIGFDPTNNLIAGARHIRVAIGRDYADVPPTRGIYKGISAVRSELAVSVRIGPVQQSQIVDDNLIAGARHIRVAIGRDYADVPPTSHRAAPAPTRKSPDSTRAHPACIAATTGVVHVANWVGSHVLALITNKRNQNIALITYGLANLLIMTPGVVTITRDILGLPARAANARESE